MTEDILFDNIYIGHSTEDAKVFAEETYEVKKPLEAVKPKPIIEDAEDADEITFTEDPIEFIRYRIFKFVDLAKIDPLVAFQTQPETGAVLVLAVVTLFGMLGAMFGLVGGSQAPITTVCDMCYSKLHCCVSFSCCSLLRPRRLMPPRRMTKRRRLRPLRLLAGTSPRLL